LTRFSCWTVRSFASEPPLVPHVENPILDQAHVADGRLQQRKFVGERAFKRGLADVHRATLALAVVVERAMKARDIMSAPAYTCGPSTDLATVAKIMWDHDCGFVPVVNASGTVTGVVTVRDICIATATRRLLPEHISAAQAMTAPIHACLSDDSVSDVLAAMKQCQIRRVPVIDTNGRLQGVIPLNDIVLASKEKREPEASDIVATMAAICAHRRVETAVARSARGVGGAQLAPFADFHLEAGTAALGQLVVRRASIVVRGTPRRCVRRRIRQPG
jgi:CBS domain-containing protein